MEGENRDIKLINRLKNLYLPQDVTIQPYKNNLYNLYDYLSGYGKNGFEDLNFLLALRENETDENIKRIFDEDYTDILLIFDFDPQDRKFDINKVLRMMEYFSESTENGRLYINYPMVESFYHLNNVREVQLDESFRDRKFTLQELRNHQYKNIVNKEGTILDIRRMSKEQVENIMYQQACKANYILEENYEVLDDCSQEKMLMILDKQNRILEQYGEAYVLNTCSFFVLEFYPSNVDFLRNQ